MRNADRQPIRVRHWLLVHGERAPHAGGIRQTLSQGAKGRGSVQVDIDLKSFGEGLGQGNGFGLVSSICFRFALVKRSGSEVVPRSVVKAGQAERSSSSAPPGVSALSGP